MEWNERIQNLWIDFLFWTRFYILSLMYPQRGGGYVASRLLRNAAEFADAFVPFYGEESAKRFEEILNQHILLLSELAATIRSKEPVEGLRTVWYENANELAQFLTSVNPHWGSATWMELLYRRYYLEEFLLMRLQNGDFFGAIEQFDNANFNAQEIANYMIDGIVQQFGVTPDAEQAELVAAPEHAILQSSYETGAMLGGSMPG